MFGKALSQTCETVVTTDRKEGDKLKTGKEVLSTKRQQLQLKKSVIDSLLQEQHHEEVEADAQIYTEVFA